MAASKPCNALRSSGSSFLNIETAISVDDMC
jgi:hypothetical protein